MKNWPWIGKLPGQRIKKDSVQMMILCCRGVVVKEGYGPEEYDENGEQAIEQGDLGTTRRNEL